MGCTVIGSHQIPNLNQRCGPRTIVDGFLHLVIPSLIDLWRTWLLLLHAFLKLAVPFKIITCILVVPTLGEQLEALLLQQAMTMMPR
nr:hypothetical protein Iba_chr06cCG1770 [Ipomoea batatas]